MARIYGIGSDIVQINRVEEALARFGTHFEERVFTESERKEATRYERQDGRPKAAFYAKRFAAKEAFAKALGTGFRGGLRMNHIGVHKDENGKPSLILEAKARELLRALGTKDEQAVVHLSLSDDYPLAQAMVIISLEPKVWKP